MVAATCLEKHYDKNNKIIKYRIQDKTDLIFDVLPDALKQAIQQEQITVDNLKLTPGNRLIEVADKTKFPTDAGLRRMITAAQNQGLKVTTIFTGDFNKVHLISKNTKEHLVVIPSDVTKLNMHYQWLSFTEHIKDLKGTIKVAGGSGLKDAQYMFADCKAFNIDLSRFDTSRVVYMDYMFCGCQAGIINLSNFNTSSVTSVYHILSNCRAKIKTTDPKILRSLN